MALTPGTRLGVYEIIAPIGEGGMGQVLRARDTKLDRDVAIKILPDAFAHDADRLARFQREAKTLASLNHPNIAAIYGLEESAGMTALVMELVEGNDLSQRIARGPILFDEALPIAKQIAEALEAAHEQGIIHRDLKPANIKVRPDGTVKVLDFGLAKAMEPAATSSQGMSMSPTITSPTMMTGVGTLLGTAAYMSPEQAKGKPADKRSDIWAFGCVLYEMLTGRRAFDGEDIVDVLGAVARLEPSWAVLSSDVTQPVRTLLQSCLVKDRRRRVGDISTVLFVLDKGASLTPVRDQASVAPRPERALWQSIAAPSAFALVIAALSGAAAWAVKPSAPLDVIRSRFVLPDGQDFTGGNRQLVSLSPDGKQMVYVANGALFLRSLSDLEARPIQGTETTDGFNTTQNPVFSPDGRSIAYWNDGALKRIASGGGTAVTLCKSDPPWGMTWGAEGIIYGLGPKGILRVSANGGTPEQLVTIKSGEMAANPQMLPGGRAVLFTLAAGGQGLQRWDTARIVVQAPGSGEPKTIVEGGSHARYIPTGNLVYALGGTLFAVPFDERRLEVTGSATPVVEGVRRSSNEINGTGSAHYSVSDTGSLVFVPGPVDASSAAREIVVMNRKGGLERMPLPPGAYRSVRTSPEGRRVVYDSDDGKEAIVWIYDLSGTSAPRRLTFGGANRFPIWSPDGQHVVFQSDRDGDRGLYWQRADGTSAAERLTKPDKGTAHVPESWSPGGERFMFSAVAGGSAALWTFSMSDKTAAQFGDVRSVAAFNAEFSPDGRWVAYTLRTVGAANVYVEPFPATGAKYQITTVNGHHPVWLPDGKGLSYRTGNFDQVVVGVTTTPSFSFGHPVPAIEERLPAIFDTQYRSYDITRDGAAFLAVGEASGNQSGAPETREIQVVTNWFEELKRLVPTK